MKNLKTFRIMLNTMPKIQEFNRNVLKYPDSHLDLISGKYRVPAKSLMGIFSLDLEKPVTLEYDEEFENDVYKLFRHFIYVGAM